jgi:hypothetical protein
MRTLSILAVVFYFAVSVPSQTKNPPHIHLEDQKELSDLNYFVGSWILTAAVNPGKAGGGGEYQQIQIIEWMKGEHFIVSHTETKGSLGNTVGLAVTGFDPDQKKFAYHAFNSTGAVEHGTGSFDGKTWIWLSEPSKPDSHLQRRITMVEVSPKEYILQLEVAPDGKNWDTVMKGKAMKKQ